MTTLIRSRNPLATLGMNPQPARRRSKRLAGCPDTDSGVAYDEEDGDFKFTRGSKRTKTERPAPDTAPIPSRTRQSKTQHAELHTEARKPGRRKMSFSAPKEDEDIITQPKRNKRQSTRSSLENSENRSAPVYASGLEDADMDSMDLVGISVTQPEPSKESTKIALPFTDTPVINRNKELRKRATGGRRSSLGMRGRRASSLIDSGHSATPHHEVETSEFYKHIEADGLSEPRRLRQLLTWCGERVLGPRPSHNIPESAAVLSARAIQEAILKDFSNRSDLSDWFSRDETQRSSEVKKPNPLNIQNQERIGELQQRVQRLEGERAHLKALRKPYTLPQQSLDPSGAPPILHAIDTALLDDEDANILALLATSSSSEVVSKTKARLESIQENIEFQVDQFADGIHKLDQACQTMEGVANRVLALSAVRLDERESKEKEKVGTRDLPIQEVLRSLSRIIPAGPRAA